MIYIYIALIYVIALDVLHFWDELSSRLSLLITKGKVSKTFLEKPLGCSTCMTFWTCLAYLLYTGTLTLPNITLIIIISAFTPEIGGVIFTIKGWIAYLLNRINP